MTHNLIKFYFNCEGNSLSAIKYGSYWSCSCSVKSPSPLRSWSTIISTNITASGLIKIFINRNLVWNNQLELKINCDLQIIFSNNNRFNLIFGNRKNQVMITQKFRKRSLLCQEKILPKKKFLRKIE